MKTIKEHILFFLLICIINDVGFSQNVLINELQASNKTTFCDGFGEFDDWIEIYNPTNHPVDLTGMFLTDDLSNPKKHQINSSNSKWVTVAAKSYLLLWMDADPEQGSRHISFKLNKQKGLVALFDSNAILVDCLKYKHQKRDYSLGRVSLHNKELAVYSTPSPKDLNKNGLILIADTVNVQTSVASGVYSKSIEIKLSANFPGSIYYTLDGSEPTLDSYKFSGSVTIDSSVVLRARVITEGYYPSKISSNTYLINEKFSIPILSIVTNPDFLWDEKRGIYTNYEKRKWEVPATIEYFDTTKNLQHNLAFSKSVDIRIAGKTSRRQPKKSFVFKSNDKDGKTTIDYKVFDDKPIENFESLWVRSDATSGRNVPEMWVGERFKNELLYQVNKQMDASVDMQSYEPVGLFLNGKYWGLYNLMERKGQNFIKNNHNEDDVHILTGESVNIVRGSSVDYEKLLGLVFGNNINDSAVYNKVCDMMDIASYIDYWVFETYCGAHDISVNIRFWKPKRENTKWRWISYDQDSWNDYDDESLDYYLSNGKVSLLERLMRNETFQHQFINRVCDFLNTGFKAENVIEKVKSITTRIHDEDLKDRARWQDTMLYVPQNQRVDSLIEYAKKRPIFLRENMISFFEIDGKVQKISINSDEQRGSVKINQIIANGNWEGDYLGGIPLKITAIPNDDYEFVRWKNRKLGKNSTVIIDPSNIQEVIPIFEKRSFVHNK